MRRFPATRLLLLAAFCACAAHGDPQKPIGEVFASDASVHGSVLLSGSGTGVLSGSSVVSGEAVASLRLERGGQVRICPRTTVSVASAPNGRDLLLGMSSGALEAEYALAASADTILTPDFRIMLSGPGNFHFAIGADAGGNTCIRTLSHNTASLIVTELMGDGVFQVKPDDEVLFRLGKLANHVRDAGACGCAAPAAPLVRAAAPPPPPIAVPPPAANPQAVQVEVEAPFVFRASDPEPELDLTPQVAHLRSERTAYISPVVLPSPEPPVVAKHHTVPRRILGKVGSFFARIFK